MHLYVKHHKVNVSANDKRPVFTQRLIAMKKAQWIEFDQKQNLIRVKMPDAFLPDEYTVDKGDDPSLVKRVFYDILKEARAEGKVIEW
jgi:hypothetical protein